MDLQHYHKCFFKFLNIFVAFKCTIVSTLIIFDYKVKTKYSMIYFYIFIHLHLDMYQEL